MKTYNNNHEACYRITLEFNSFQGIVEIYEFKSAIDKALLKYSEHFAVSEVLYPTCITPVNNPKYTDNSYLHIRCSFLARPLNNEVSTFYALLYEDDYKEQE
jgi:hypothetical protein